MEGDVFMKIIAVNSSPRKNGNTYAIIEKILEGAVKSGHDILKYDLEDMNFKGCTACRACKETGSFCVIKDDLIDYWNELISADVLVWGSPNYMGTINGTLKTFIDRHYCTKDKSMKSKLQSGRRAILVLSQGHSDPNYYLDNYRFLEKYLKTHEMDVEMMIHSGHSHANEDNALMQEAYELGKTF